MTRANRPAAVRTIQPAQLTLPFEYPPALDAEDFLVTPANAEAAAWLEPERNWPGPALVLHGPAGSGKSHLARLWSLREAAATLEPAALLPESVPQLIPASLTLVIDGAERIAGTATTEQALFHLYNLLAAAGGRLLLVAVAPVSGWGLRLPDLESRLRTAPSVAIAPPDDSLLAALLVKLLADRQLRPPADVVAYLVPRMERSCAAVAKLVAELDRVALAAHRPITLALARSVLETPEGP